MPRLTHCARSLAARQAGVCIPVILVLVIYVAYLRHQTKVKRKAINELRHWLQLERVDMKHMLRMKRIVT